MVNLKNLNNPHVAGWLLRIGLAFVFVYAGVGSLRQPLEWAGYLPGFLARMSDVTTIIKIFAVYELLIAAWLLVGKYLQICAVLCALTMVGIVFADPGSLIITFRDIGLAFMALALFFLA